MKTVAQAVDSIIKTAGWREASPNAEGIFHFELEGGLDVDVFSPEGRTIILSSMLDTLNGRTAEEKEELVKRLSALSVAGQKKNSAICGIDGDEVELFVSANLEELTEQSAANLMKDFLNACSWWQGQLNMATFGGNSGKMNSQFMFGFDNPMFNNGIF